MVETNHLHRRSTIHYAVHVHHGERKITLTKNGPVHHHLHTVVPTEDPQHVLCTLEPMKAWTLMDDSNARKVWIPWGLTSEQQLPHPQSSYTYVIFVAQ